MVPVVLGFSSSFFITPNTKACVFYKYILCTVQQSLRQYLIRANALPSHVAYSCTDYVIAPRKLGYEFLPTLLLVIYSQMIEDYYSMVNLVDYSFAIYNSYCANKKI